MKNIIEIFFLLAAIFYLMIAGIEKIVFLVEKKKTSTCNSFGKVEKKKFFFFN